MCNVHLHQYRPPLYIVTLQAIVKNDLDSNLLWLVFISQCGHVVAETAENIEEIYLACFEKQELLLLKILPLRAYVLGHTNSEGMLTHYSIVLAPALP